MPTTNVIKDNICNKSQHNNQNTNRVVNKRINANEKFYNI